MSLDSADVTVTSLETQLSVCM